MSDTPSSPPAESINKPPSFQIPPWAVLAVVVLSLIAGLAFARSPWGQRLFPLYPPMAPSTPPPLPPTPPSPPEPPQPPTLPETPSSTRDIPQTTDQTPNVDTRRASVTVSWFDYGRKQPIHQAMDRLESFAKHPNTEPDFAKYFENGNAYTYKPEERTTGFWQKGTVRGGEFNEWGVYLRRYAEEGMGTFYFNHYLLISPDGKQALLLASESPFAWDTLFLTFAPNIQIANPGTLPDRITLINGKMLYRYESQDVNQDDHSECTSRQCYDATFQLTTKEGIRLYDGGSAARTFFSGEGCLVAFTDAGFQAFYSSRIPTNSTSTRVGEETIALKTPQITWKTGWNTTDAFVSFKVTGCGSQSCTDVVRPEDVGPMAGLMQVGTTVDGDAVYLPRNLKDHPETQKVYETWMQYDNNGEKPDLDAFLRRYRVPYFFWKDAFDRWVRYVNNDTVPLAECGKPVIYLYPEKTTDVSVKLPSFVQVTVSEPTYSRGGWNVSAEPNGQLTMKDGSRYGSLFWEGVGVAYQMPTEGFIVKDGEVDTFLQTTLAKYGLNDTESREFREFWVPRMTGAPYYRVGFLTDSWDKAAPLSVVPRPTTSIRLFMDWRKLGAPISIPEPRIVTPKREGFTLVEWGGTLWK